MCAYITSLYIHRHNDIVVYRPRMKHTNIIKVANCWCAKCGSMYGVQCAWALSVGIEYGAHSIEA